MNEQGDIVRCHIPEGQNYSPKCQKYDGETQYFQCRKGKWCHTASDCPVKISFSFDAFILKSNHLSKPERVQQSTAVKKGVVLP